jgi:nucleoid-associated protein YgaU
MSVPPKAMTGTYIIIGISLLTVAFLGFSYLKTSSSQQELIVRNEALKDSIILLRTTAIATAAPETTRPTIKPKEAIVRYVVKKGDYPYKIAQFFYGDGGRYRQIETDNNLTNPYSLKIGQVLTIKIVQE